VRAEIVERLGMREPLVVTGTFDRPEIDLRVDTFARAQAKRDAVVELVVHRGGPGIVYVATRRNATAVASALSAAGVEAASYHGALGRKQRAEVHDGFLARATRVVVATNAFGMGIDKADVRFVVHHDVPASLDAYYPEIGRAGRDGDDAEAILCYQPGDLALQKFFAGGGLDVETFAAVLRAASAASRPVSATRLAADTGLPRARVTVAIDGLTRAGAVRRDGRGRVADVTAADARAAVASAVEAEEGRRRLERSRIEMMRAYAETAWCRRAVLLGYYGEELVSPCGRCDNCRAGLVEPPARRAPFPVGERVVHTEWGGGTVMITEAERFVVLFDTAGYRTLSTKLVLDKGLLEHGFRRPGVGSARGG